MTFTFANNISRNDACVAVLAASGIDGGAPLPAAQDGELLALLASRKESGLSAAEEVRRAACRNMLRNGAYKPTGRGKPASEYLLGAAKEGSFPRVNALVDMNNLVSLKHLLPISIWDADLCSSGDFEFRLGRAGESYVFNPSGQELSLDGLICGCELAGGVSRPAVTPIKDGMRTKVRPGTRTVLGAIYYPGDVLSAAEAEAVNGEFLRGLLGISEGAKGAMALLLPGEKKDLVI